MSTNVHDPSYRRDVMWKTAGLIVLRNNGFIYCDEFDIHVTHVTLSDEKELFLYNLKGGNKWFVTETKKQFERMREYMQRAGI